MKSANGRRRLIALVILTAACIVALMPTVPVNVPYTYTYSLPPETNTIVVQTTFTGTYYPNLFTVYILTTSKWTTTSTKTPISSTIATSTSYAPLLEVAANGQWSTIAVGAIIILILLVGAVLVLRFGRRPNGFRFSRIESCVLSRRTQLS